MFNGGFGQRMAKTVLASETYSATSGNTEIGCGRSVAIKKVMPGPIKHSVAVMIFRGDQILAVRRPDDDEELPGIWGLPAGTCRGTESIEDVIRRIGHDKLGVTLSPTRKLSSGTQDRTTYRLEMELWEATMEGIPTHPQWQWSGLDLLNPGAANGSLCCALAIKSKSRVS